MSSSAEQINWKQTLEGLQHELDQQVYSAFVAPLMVSNFDRENFEFVIKAPSKFICDHLEANKDCSDNKIRAKIENALASNLGLVSSDGLKLTPKLKFIVEKSLAEPKQEETRIIINKVLPQIAKPQSLPKNDIPHKINSRYTFDNFIVGNNNQFCHAAARRVAEMPGKSYNPLFMYGGVGLGKTHLLHAIGNEVLKRNPLANVSYMSAEVFMNELIVALRNDKMGEFRARFRNIEVLLIDDIQFICGKERTQEEFFHTFNALYEAKHQIVISSDKIPQDINGLEDRLRTRFSWGLTADLQAPDFETRLAILKGKSFNDNFYLPHDVAEYIAQNFSSNVRELEGALTRLHALSSLQGRIISMESAQATLSALFQPKSVNISVEDIKKVVSTVFNVKVSELISKKRTKNLSFPRHIAMYLCRKFTTCSYPEIGSHFGGRDHSSVIHAANVVAEKMNKDSEIRKMVENLEKSIFSH